jgi:hypothetical protein
MCFGSMPNDAGHLTLNYEEYNTFILEHPKALKFIKILRGSQEFINDIPRWCLWIENEDLEEAISNFSFIKERVDKVKKHRSSSDRKATNSLANIAHRFGEIRYKPTLSIIVPSVSSERREYIPMGFLDKNTVITNLAFAIYDAAPFIFSVLNSRMHMTWVRAVCGSLETRIRYSSTLCYNTFPMPPLSIEQQKALESHVYRILEEREAHSEKTLAELYDPDKMPEGLRQAHRDNDLAVERIYRAKPFESDEERLAYLFKLYEEMIAAEKAGGFLLNDKKSKKK